MKMVFICFRCMGEAWRETMCLLAGGNVVNSIMKKLVVFICLYIKLHSVHSEFSYRLSSYSTVIFLFDIETSKAHFY